MRDRCGERWQCWDHHSNRGLDDHVCRAPRLVPNAVMKPIGQAGVIDNNCSTRQVAYDRASVWIDMVVSVTRIVMLPVRLSPEKVVLLLGAAVCTVLSVPVRRNEAGNKERGIQEARHSHGSSPFAGRHGTEAGPDRW